MSMQKILRLCFLLVFSNGCGFILGDAQDLSSQDTSSPTAPTNLDDGLQVASLTSSGVLTWTQEAFIKTPNSDANESVGTPNAEYSGMPSGSLLSLGSDTLALGVFTEASNQTSITNGTSASANNANASSGAAYVFTR